MQSKAVSAWILAAAGSAGLALHLPAAGAADAATRPVFEDDNIRVVVEAIAPGATEPRRPQPLGSVVVFDAPARIEYLDATGRAAEVGNTGLQTPSGLPFVALLPAGSTVAIRNVDTRPVHFTRIEFRQGMRAPRIIPPFWGTRPMPISTDGTDPKTWNPREEALVAAADHHRVIFESDSLRVLSVTDEPGTEEALHRHAYPSVAVFDRISHAILRGPDEKPFPQEVVAEHNPTVLVLPAQGMHRVSNPDTSPEHLTRIEFKRGFAP